MARKDEDPQEKTSGTPNLIEHVGRVILKILDRIIPNKDSKGQ